MSDILKNLYNACHPLRPAEPKFYTDLSRERGGETFIHTMCEELERSTERVCALFTGHNGCGKSSELERLAHELFALSPECPHSRYFPVVINALDYVDVFDASLQEILLSIVSELAAKLRAIEQIELKNTVLENVWREIAGIARGVKLSKATPLGDIKFEVTLNRADPTVREKVRKYLAPQTTSLLTEINNALIEARASLGQKTPRDNGPMYRDIVLVLDNLEKVQKLAGHTEGESSARALFIEGAPQLSALKSHVIYTVHLSLARAAGQELMIAYGNEPVVLSNVKTEERGSHARWEPGRAALRELLEKRTHPHELKQVFTPDTLDFILDYCGGHLRQFLNFVRESTLYTDQTPIPLQAAQKAVTQAVPSYSTAMRDEDWSLLAQLERTADQRWDTNALEKRALMERLCVLEYMNGDRAQDIFNKAMPWYAVHPIVRELSPFKSAVNALKKTVTQ